MTSPRYCDLGGMLASARGRVPDDPCERCLVALHAWCGCNRLRCRACGAPVTAAPPPPGAESRVYACACARWECWQPIESIDREHDTPTMAQVDWWCDGHPAPALPLHLGALELGAAPDFADVVQRVLDGACPRAITPAAGPDHDGPSLWLGWLYAYLADADAAALSSALAARIDDPDPRVRGRVLDFFLRLPRAPGIARVLAHLETNLAACAIGHPIPERWTPPTFFDVVRARLEASRASRPPTHDPLDARADALLRRILQTPLAELSHADLGPIVPPATARTDVVADALEACSPAFRDADLHHWIADHIVALDAAAPGRWRGLMTLLAGWYAKPALGHLIVIAGMAVLQSGAVSAADFRAWLEWGRYNHLWMDDAWVMPLRSVLDALDAPDARP